jgi:hypothetical protein
MIETFVTYVRSHTSVNVLRIAVSAIATARRGMRIPSLVVRRERVSEDAP